MAEPEAEVTDDQANAALQQMIDDEVPVETTVETTVESAPAEQPAETPAGTVEAAPEGAEAAPAEVTPAEGESGATVATGTTDEKPADDVKSLLARNKELETAATTAEERHNSRIEALKQRSQQNEQIMRDRLLKKSTLSDRMAQTLRKSRSTDGVPEAEVDQVIRDFDGSLNPASASYVAPAQPAATADSNDQVLVLNEFLNEKGMDLKEQDQFSTWIKTEAGNVMSQEEQNVANESLGGFLRLAHYTWQSGVKQKAAKNESKRSDAVNAARSVQRTQREAARAASPVTAAPITQPVSKAAEPDYDKFSSDDVSALLKKSVEEYQ